MTPGACVTPRRRRPHNTATHLLRLKREWACGAHGVGISGASPPRSLGSVVEVDVLSVGLGWGWDHLAVEAAGIMAEMQCLNHRGLQPATECTTVFGVCMARGLAARGPRQC